MRSAWPRVVKFVLPLRDLPAEERAAIEEDRRELNRRRVQMFAAAMFAVHLAFCIVYAVGDTPAEHAAWRRNLQVIHAVMLAITAALAAWSRRARTPRGIGESFLLIYLGYGTAVSINSQLTGQGIDVFTIVILLLAFGLRVHAGVWTIGAAASLAALLAGVQVVQRAPMARFAAVANGVPLVIVAWLFARAQLSAFVHECLQRRLIERQRDALAGLNERLDRALRDKVGERSRELGLALRAVGRVSYDDLAPGVVLRDRFAIDRLLGRGAMGAVYRAHDRLLGRAVAIKVLSAPADELALQRFLREVEIMAEIAHPAIVRSLHVDVSEAGRLFQVQELVPGEPLDRVQRRRGTFAAGHVARIGCVLADALHAAHARGVVHRDVKPANVMLTEAEPGLKLLDFGISKLRGGHTIDTRADAVLGTPAFMAPEQLGAAEVDDRADVYALGATLSLLLAGRPWTRGAGARAAAAPAELEGVLARCLEEDPALRPPAAELRDALAGVARAAHAPELAAWNERLVSAPEATAVTAV